MLIDPKVSINVLSWTNDVLTVAVFSTVLLAFLLLAVIAALWYSKSQHRHTERLQRRNSIRQSLNSLRSLSSSQTGFNELSYKRKTLSVSISIFHFSLNRIYKIEAMCCLYIHVLFSIYSIRKLYCTISFLSVVHLKMFSQHENFFIIFSKSFFLFTISCNFF